MTDMRQILASMRDLIGSPSERRLGHFETYQLLLFICAGTDVQYGELDCLVRDLDAVGDLVLTQEEATQEQAAAVIVYRVAEGMIKDDSPEGIRQHVAEASRRVRLRRETWWQSPLEAASLFCGTRVGRDLSATS